MGKFNAPGDTVDHIVTAQNVTDGLNFSGKLILVGSLVGMVKSVSLPSESANGGAEAGKPVSLLLEGNVSYNKATADTWAVGATIYLDATADEITSVATSNTPCGVALEAGTAGTQDTAFKLGQFIAATA